MNAEPTPNADSPTPQDQSLQAETAIPPTPTEAADLSAAQSARVAELEADVARFKDQALRALAEAENTRRRAQREIEDNTKYAIVNLARDVLGVADNLRRALDSLTAESRGADERLDKFAQGVELTERELLAAFERYAIARVDPLGQPFDHNLHQAIMQLDVPDKPAGTVVQVLQPGYTIHGRLLRPALVAVAKGNAAGPAGTKVNTTA